MFRRFFQLHGMEVREVETLDEAMLILPGFQPDLMVVDLESAADPAFDRCRVLAGTLPILFHGGGVTAWEAWRQPGERSAFLAHPFTLLDFHLALQGLLS